MGDPTNRNDPEYANNPHYVWSGGRWQYVSNPATANEPAAGGHVTGTTVWTDPFKHKSGADQVAAMGGDINNFANYQQLAQQFRGGATRQQAVNPYNTGIADQSRAAQLALIQQMRGQMAGPSLAAMQGQRALAQSGQQALGAAAMGAPGRAAMLQAQGVGAGLAGDVGQARLAEQMRAQGSMGGAAGSLRGADLRSADAQSQAGLQAQRLSDAQAMFYGQLGTTLDQARARQALERFKLGQRIDQRQTARDIQLGSDLVGAGANAFAAMMQGSGK